MKLKRSAQFVRLSCSALLLTGLAIPSLSVPTLPAMAGQPLTIAQAQQRMRIAVLDFDFASTGITTAGWGYWGDVGPAKGVSDLLTNKLVEGGSYSVIERSKVAAILAEQNLAQAGRIDPATAAQIGRILGVDAVVVGSVTRFNLQEGGTGGSILGIGGNSRRHSAEVQLTARLVNTTTAEILATAQGTGEAKQGGGGFSIGGLVTFGNDNNNTDGLLSKAAEDAVSQISTSLSAESARLSALPASLPSIEAIVADVAGNEVIINKGSQDGFRTGMTLSIERVVREVKDPATGAVLRTVTSPIGRIELTEVDPGSCVGRIVNGTGFRVGDRAVAAQ
ncbi:MAG: CsgG/HfaB family protein [Drouetiella hepatica Uher 2000/2452]|uniref:CsgG/HfaB family protein n=1 Tax=Drouetiella hepatica Uher 2000/2452 TaxID=904376 RepID=A0A951UL49_9CYAN|nr:CsgG/HfaB family protein [Drouetiella hepatica Uher 2000/2452]